jgi:hypothetical protein
VPEFVTAALLLSATVLGVGMVALGVGVGSLARALRQRAERPPTILDWPTAPRRRS